MNLVLFFPISTCRGLSIALVPRKACVKMGSPRLGFSARLCEGPSVYLLQKAGGFFTLKLSQTHKRPAQGWRYSQVHPWRAGSRKGLHTHSVIVFDKLRCVSAEPLSFHLTFWEQTPTLHFHTQKSLQVSVLSQRSVALELAGGREIESQRPRRSPRPTLVPIVIIRDLSY